MAPRVPPTINIEPEDCPEAVIEWYRISGLEDRRESRWELRYTSPSTGKKLHFSQNCLRELHSRRRVQPVNNGTPESEGYPDSPKVRNTLVLQILHNQVKERKDQFPLLNKQNQILNQENAGLQPKRGKKRERKSSSEDELTSVVNTESEVTPKKSLVYRLGTRAKQGDEAQSSYLSKRNPRTIVSWLIDNGVVLLDSKVFCRGTNNVVKNGRLLRSGIACDCCGNIFTLTRFETHASCTRHRPSTSIFLENGTSLLQCQMDALRFLDNMQRDNFQDRNESVCSICRYGGELVLCDRCPSSFHLSCLGLDHVPDGDWFCPPCCCRICNRPRCREDSEDDVDNNILSCCQCERKFHIGCLKSKGFSDMEDLPNPNNKWFCKKECENIFCTLQKLVGNPIRVAAHTLDWTLLKTFRSDDNSGGDLSPDGLERLSQIESNRGSEFNRPNCGGFYTVILEMNDEVVSVATVRIHGQKVAELPFVATSEQYRKLGLCRILMNELEKQLTQLGVESMVLPSSNNAVDTWTNSFDFARMTDSDKSQFLEYSFLEFQDTTWCHKPLLVNPSMNCMA
ncbi:Zinc finger, PHD-type [Sesbania bispinosa]|nr:Zinc finger, PHD-type [Sesbania bispinosa]